MCEARWRILRALGFGFFVRFETQILRVDVAKKLAVWAGFLARDPLLLLWTGTELRRIAFLR